MHSPLTASAGDPFSGFRVLLIPVSHSWYRNAVISFSKGEDVLVGMYLEPVERGQKCIHALWLGPGAHALTARQLLFSDVGGKPASTRVGSAWCG